MVKRSRALESEHLVMRSPPARYSVTKTELRGDSKRPTWGLEACHHCHHRLKEADQLNDKSGLDQRSKNFSLATNFMFLLTAWEMYSKYITFRDNPREGNLHLAQVFGGSALSRLPLSDKINIRSGFGIIVCTT